MPVAMPFQPMPAAAPLSSSGNDGFGVPEPGAHALASLQSAPPATDEELAQRTALGIWIYPAMWLTLSLATDLSQRWPLVVWGNVAGLMTMAICRALLNRHLAHLLAQRPRPTALAFQGLTLAISAYWGTLTGVCMVLAPSQPAAWMMLTMTVAFCAGGNTLFGINPALRVAYPVAMIAPVVIAQAMEPSPEQRMMMFIEVALMFYLNRSSSLVYKDYWDARHAQRLSDQRARELELASLTDGLTQVPNRLYFERQYAYEWARQCRHGGQVSVMIVDLDHFKQINDTWGHPFGDQCLQQVARALTGACGRSTDFVARYGGEEFVVLLAETDAAGARTVAERMRQHISALPVMHEGTPVALSCSIGLCTTVPHPGKSAQATIDVADKALYRAKHGGRNQVVAVDTSHELLRLRQHG
jgi:diguanylate cyclase (GGDEF)-like protein